MYNVYAQLSSPFLGSTQLHNSITTKKTTAITELITGRTELVSIVLVLGTELGARLEEGSLLTSVARQATFHSAVECRD